MANPYRDRLYTHDLLAGEELAQNLCSSRPKGNLSRSTEMSSNLQDKNSEGLDKDNEADERPRWIKDRSQVKIGTKSRARSSLPSSLYLMPSAIRGDGMLGVFAKEVFQENIWFGPFVGQEIQTQRDLSNEMDQTFCWDVIINGHLDHIVDGRCEQHSNWMRFVSCARDHMEQNLVALECSGKIFYKVSKRIKPGHELLVWFDMKYCCKLDSQAECRLVTVGSKFCCEGCGDSFAGSSYLDKHRKYRCRPKMNFSSSEEGTPSLKQTEDAPLTMEAENRDSSEADGRILGNQDKDTRTRDGKKTSRRKSDSYCCKTCCKVYKHNCHLRRHERIVHTDNKATTSNNKCQECGKNFSRKSSLIYHQSNHGTTNGGPKPTFKCSMCAVTFRRECDKKRHEDRVHSGTKPHKCEECGKSFSWKISLTKHKRVHSREKAFDCWICGKSVGSPSALSRHVMLHTGEKPHQCSTCDKRFSRSDQLKIHEKKHSVKTAPTINKL